MPDLDYAALLAALPAPVVLTTDELERPGPQIVYVNPAFEAMTGYSASEVVGRTPRLLQGAATDPATVRRLRDRLRRGLPFHGETVNYRKDGTPYAVEWRIVPFPRPEARTHWLSIQHDVTDRKRNETAALDHVARYAAAHGRPRLHEHPEGLLPALRTLCDGAAALYGSSCGLSFDRPLVLTSGPCAARLYAATRAALLHAVAERAAPSTIVSVSALAGAPAISVTDDSPSAPHLASPTLQTAAHHARQAGGALSVHGPTVLIAMTPAVTPPV